MTARDVDRGFELLPPPRAARGDSRSSTTPRRTVRQLPRHPAVTAPATPTARLPSPAPTTAPTPAGPEPAVRAGAAPDTTVRPPPWEPVAPGPALQEDLGDRAVRDLLDERMRRLSDLLPGNRAHRLLRQQIVESQLPLVHHLAQRFRGRGEPYDDLVQVGTIGLLNAVDRFDPNRGSFSSFAIPTILGELRRHFRDRGWAMRVPRRLQDFGRRVAVTREQLTHRLGRSPTVQELAAELHADPDLVVEAIETATVFATVPLPSASEESLFDSLSSLDQGLEQVEHRAILDPLLARLPTRERRILALRFGRGLSQSQIAAEVGVSQMHVSRLLTRSLTTLREGLTEEV